MIIILLIFALGLPLLYSSAFAFEFLFGILLLTPILAFPLAKLFGTSSALYWMLLLGLTGLKYLLRDRRSRGLSQRGITEIYPIILFILIYSVAYGLCMLWPDFIAMGERLRDYSMLGAVLRDPLNPIEPWMSGSRLYYYVYWYRVGAMFASLFGLQVFEVYHILVAFSIAFYVTAIFRLLSRLAVFSTAGAIVSSLIIGFGSNLAGVIAAFTKDENWWGPSRVIAGAINEFPAWSFLLGDLHPHFANLGLIPYLICVFLAIYASPSKLYLRMPVERVLLLLGLLIVPPLWIRNSNAWELPIWAVIVVVYAAAHLIFTKARILMLRRRVWPAWRSFMTMPNLFYLGLLFWIALSLIWSLPKIPAGDNPIHWVKAPIANSRTFELLRHWGIALFLIGTCNIILFREGALRLFAFAAIAGSLLFDDASVLLVILFGLATLRVIESYQLASGVAVKNLDTPSLICELLGLCGLLLVIFPEVAFVDDPYGGENERMNTIFKFYTCAWFMLHVYGFWLLARVLGKFYWLHEVGYGRYVVQLVVLVSLFYFTARTVILRRTGEQTVAPRAEGLSEVERRFPGSAALIKELRRLPPGVVLEAQGNAYDYTTFVSTLANQQAYLGWANHVNLITKEVAEVSRREQFTEDWYKNSNCQEKKAALAREGIQYVVFGSLERKRYGANRLEWFACLKKLAEYKDYLLFEP